MLFETDRTKTKYLDYNDLQDLILLQQDAEVMRYITGKPMHSEEIIEKLKRDIEQYTSDSPWIIVMGVQEKISDSFLGTIALYYSEENHWEIAYRFMPRYWGRGYGKEVVIGLLHYIMAEGRLTEVYGTAVRDNLGSIRIMEGAGMQFVREYYQEEEKVFLREYVLPMKTCSK